MRLLVIDKTFCLPKALSAPFPVSAWYARTEESALEQLRAAQFDGCILSEEFIMLLARFPARLPVVILGRGSDASAMQMAMEYGAVDYLRLPVEEERLLAGLTRIAERRDLRQGYELWMKNREVVRTSFWSGLLDGTVSTTREGILREAEDCDVAVQGVFQPVYVHIQPKTPLWRTPEEDADALELKRLDAQIRKQVFSYFSMFAGMVFLKVEPYVYLLVVPYADTEHPYDTLCGCCQRMIADCQSRQLDTMMQLGDPADIFSIGQSMVRVMKTGRERVYIDNQLIPSTLEFKQIENPPQPNLQRILTLLDCGMYKEAIAVVTEFFYDPKVIPMVNLHFLENYKYQFLNGLLELSLVRKSNINIFQHIPDQVLSICGKTVNNFLALVSIVCETLEQVRQDEDINSVHSIVDKVQIHILEHLGENISRGSVAEFFYITPDYLDRIFKQELGQTVTKFILQARISLAQQILMSSALPVSEIASKAGFANPSHFSNLFKQQTGLSPAQFRRLNSHRP